MLSNLPPGCTDREIEEAFGVPEGYEAFAEEFAGGDHDAAERASKYIAKDWRANRTQSNNPEVHTAENVIAKLLEGAENLAVACDELGRTWEYDAALEAAWRDHQEAGV